MIAITRGFKLAAAFSAAAIWVLSVAPSLAVNEKSDGWPWNLKLHGYHDREVAEELGSGWFLNVGPTGIRARITHENPQYLTVKYVFKKSPAAGLIKIDDVIVGANGTRLTVEHYFGRGSRGRSTWDGPMVDMSKLIEDSQGKDGKLELIVWPGGVKSAEKTVTVQIPAIGRFSPTWPFNCPRSDKLLVDLCDFLVEDHNRAGKFEGGPHSDASAVLAVMASGEKKYDSFLKDIISGYYDKRYDPTNGEGFPAWGQVHDGIVMGEYYLLTKDRRLLPAIESLVECLDNSVWPETGGLSHRPFAAIMRRMAAGGPKGYGAMAMPAGQGMLALSLFKEAGLDHAAASYERIHQAFLCTVTPSGAIDYGFTSWDHATIRLKDPKGSPKSSPDGIGFECPEGMKNIGDYEILWPTKQDPRYRDTAWIAKEKNTNRVFDAGGDKRAIIRAMAPDEPTKPYQHDGESCDHHGRSGVGALAHKIGNRDNKSYGYLADFMATGCAKSGKGLLDGHASTHMHVLWGSLGAAMAKEKDFREYLEDIRWWMIMAQTHDGGFVVMPGRDYASTDHVYGTRTFPTGCAALILSVKEKRLQITGAGGSGAPAAKRSSGLASKVPAGRPARAFKSNLKSKLDQSLVLALGEISHSDTFQRLPMSLSKAASKVIFAGVESDGRLVFEAPTGGSRALFAFDELGSADHALLARLLARHRPADSEANCLAGIYLEISGETTQADEYFARISPETKTVSDGFFE